MSTGIAALGLAVVAVTPAGIVWVLMRGKVVSARATYAAARKLWTARNLGLHGEMVRLEAENASLQERNAFLVGLVGADVEQAALHGSCADEVGRV